MLLLLALPRVLDLHSLINATIFASLAILALSLAFVWGFAGILSFGQAAFFGMGGYTYAVAGINLGDTTGAIGLGILVPALFAALLGYFMFWGRISDVYLGVITLTVSLILFRLLNGTAGDAWKIGDAPLGGFNGIPQTPVINWPGRPGEALTPDGVFYLAMGLLLLVYVGCRALLASRFGRVAGRPSARTSGAPSCSATTRAVQAGRLRDRRRHRGARGHSLRELRVREPDHVQPELQRPDHHLGDRRRRRHPDRADRRLRRWSSSSRPRSAPRGGSTRTSCSASS